MEKKTNINIRLPDSLKEDVKKYLGENASDELRKALESLVIKKKNSSSPYCYCFVCDKTKDSFEDMNITLKLEWDDDNVFTPIVCDDCLDSIIKTSIKDIVDGLKENESDKLIRKLCIKHTLYSDDSGNQDIEIISTIKKLKQFPKDVLWLEQHLVEAYPTLYRIEPGRIIMSKNFDNIHEKSRELLDMYDYMTK